MIKRYTKLTIIALLSLSLGTSQLSAKGRTKNVFQKTRQITTSHVKKATAAFAELTDYCLYPLLCIGVGSIIYNERISNRIPASRSYLKLEAKVPYAQKTRNALVQLIIGTLALKTAHSALQTNKFGSFMKTRMPRLTRLISHISNETEKDGTSKKRRAL